MDATQIVVVGLVVVAVVAFIVWPIIAKTRVAAGAHAVDVDRVESRIGEYRAALRRNTVCERCMFANIDGARFCAECGSRLPSAETAA